VHGILLLEQRWIECLGEQVMGIITAQDSQSLRTCLHFQLPGLLALFPLRICHTALLLQHHQELLIRRQRLFGVGNILLCLCIFFISVSQLLCLRIDLLLSGLDLILLLLFFSCNTRSQGRCLASQRSSGMTAARGYASVTLPLQDNKICGGPDTDRHKDTGASPLMFQTPRH